MEKLKYIIGIFCCLFLFSSCATSQFNPVQPHVIEFEKTPKYEFDWESLQLPEPLKRKYADENMNFVSSKEDYKYIVLDAQEYAKIVALLELFHQSKDIIGEQVILINTNIDIINSLKEYIELEQYKTASYRELWINSEQAYRDERRQHKIDNAINKAANILITIGAVVIAIVAL